MVQKNEYSGKAQLHENSTEVTILFIHFIIPPPPPLHEISRVHIYNDCQGISDLYYSENNHSSQYRINLNA